MLRLRHAAYDNGVLKSHKTTIPSINIGNLQIGGSGKSPMTKYIRALFPKKKIGLISRGYGRSSKELLLGKGVQASSILGDEVADFAKKFPYTPYALHGNRQKAVKAFTKKYPNTELLLFDDAFQHRAIRANINILMCSYEKLFFDEAIWPAGNLRDLKVRAHFAEIIVINKCPLQIAQEDKKRIKEKVRIYSQATVFFAHYDIANIEIVLATEDIDKNKKVALISAIAEPAYFESMAKQQYSLAKHFSFKDHYSFAQTDIEKLIAVMKKMDYSQLICTSKDAVKLRQFKPIFKVEGINLYQLNIKLTIAEHAQFATQLNNLLQN